MFYMTRRLGCHNLLHVLLSRFKGIDAVEPYFSTYFLLKKEAVSSVA
jgi:hypothetical protein